MVLSASEVILEYVCPTMGVILGNVMFSAPYRDVRAALERNSLGDLNPTPWAFMLGNCVGWVAYAFLINNLFVFFGNAFALVLSAWLNMQAVKLQSIHHHSQLLRKSIIHRLEEDKSSTYVSTKNCNMEEQGGVEAPVAEVDEKRGLADLAKVIWNVTAQNEAAPVSHERIVVGLVIVWIAIISTVAFGKEISSTTRELIVGVTVNLNLVFFYGAPLSTIWTVVRSRSSGSIHRPTMWANTGNGIFWCAYGFAIWDLFIFVPNGLGALLGIVQFLLTFLFPRTIESENEGNGTDPSSPQECAFDIEEDP